MLLNTGIGDEEATDIGILFVSLGLVNKYAVMLTDVVVVRWQSSWILMSAHCRRLLPYPV